MDALMAPDIPADLQRGELPGQGRVLEGLRLEHKGPLALIELQHATIRRSNLAGTENSYVITRYNWSRYYAMAVIDLGREVKEALARKQS